MTTIASLKTRRGAQNRADRFNAQPVTLETGVTVFATVEHDQVARLFNVVLVETHPGLPQDCTDAACCAAPVTVLPDVNAYVHTAAVAPQEQPQACFDGLCDHEDEAPSTVCEWFVRCDNNTTTGLEHPVLGLVPCCTRCATTVGEAHQLVQLAPAENPRERALREGTVLGQYEDHKDGCDFVEGRTLVCTCTFP